jgi:hypothetical protein
MQEAKHKDKGLRVWRDNLFQSWLLSRVLMFFIQFDPYAYEREMIVRKWKNTIQEKWRCKEEACCKRFCSNLTPTFTKSSQLYQQSSFQFPT